MYTGIVDHLGEIIKLQETAAGIYLSIKTNFENIVPGESILIDGICVTAIDPQQNTFACDLSPETLKLTTAKNFKMGAKVNLERSLQLGDRFGGHFVMGHVDTIAQISLVQAAGAFTRVGFIGLSAADMAYFVKKGSISVNGISLTINEVNTEGFEVMLIPHTKMRTNMQFLQVGDWVNIEFDPIVRVVLNQFKTLANAGLMHEKIF